MKIWMVECGDVGLRDGCWAARVFTLPWFIFADLLLSLLSAPQAVARALGFFGLKREGGKDLTAPRWGDWLCWKGLQIVML